MLSYFVNLILIVGISAPWRNEPNSNQTRDLRDQCPLPYPFKDQSYTIADCQENPSKSICRAKPGDYTNQRVDLNFNCNENFVNPEGKSNFSVSCVKGNWVPKITLCRPKPPTCSLPDQKGKYVYTVYNSSSSSPPPPLRNLRNYIEPKPGDNVDQFTVIKFKCVENYRNLERENEYFSFCFEGEWSPSLANCTRKWNGYLATRNKAVNKCKNYGKVGICDKIETPANVDSTCYRYDKKVVCDDVLVSGTKIIPLCKPNHKVKGNATYFEIYCDDSGNWSNPLFECEEAQRIRMIKRNRKRESSYPCNEEIKPTESNLVRQTEPSVKKREFLNWCLSCICEAKTGCNKTADCGDFFCGSFELTQAFWIDAGMHTVRDDEDPSSNDAFTNCATDARCAGTTVASYMRKFEQDCNADGVIDCYDYSAIHQLGAYGCKGKLDNDFFNNINTCISRITKNNEEQLKIKT